MMSTSVSRPKTGLPQQQYRIGTRVTVAGQHGSVIGIDLHRGWLEVDFDRVGQQWIEIAHAQPANTHSDTPSTPTVGHERPSAPAPSTAVDQRSQ